MCFLRFFFVILEFAMHEGLSRCHNGRGESHAPLGDDYEDAYVPDTEGEDSGNDDATYFLNLNGFLRHLVRVLPRPSDIP
ncbi:hypothetical protein V6N13_034065 [Hibiscus sabdariffa]